MATETTRNPSAAPPAGAVPSDPVPASDRLLGSRRDNVDLLKALFLGVVVTALFYEVFPLPFIERGRILSVFDNPISEVITGMSFWSLFMLLFKYLNFRVQARAQQAFGEEGVLAVLSQGVYARNVDDVLRQLGAELVRLKVKNFQGSAMYRRVYQVLHYIRSAPKKETLNDLLANQSQIDLKRLETSYSLLQVFIWAIPILGFIGTVLGIGDSVREFSVFIQTAEAGAQFSTQMRTALGGVTSGLAVAFNTTFLALVLVVPIMVITSFLVKNEEEVLSSVEEFCLERLLPHLHISPSDAGVKETFDEHMHRIMQLSGNWLSQLEPLVQQLSRQTEMVSHQIGGVQPLVKDFTDRLLVERGVAPPAAEPAPARRKRAAARPAGRSKPAGTTARSKSAGTARPRRRAPARREN